MDMHTPHRNKLCLLKVCLAFIIMAHVCPVIAERAVLNPDKLSFRHLTEEKGLTNSSVYCISQDKKGFIWIGTENGLYRYDGYSFRHYLNLPGDTLSINSNVVFELYNDSHDNLWIGTFMGLMRYNDSLDIFLDFNINNILRNGSPIPVNTITEDKEGTVFVATDAGLACVNPHTYDFSLIPPGSAACWYEGSSVSAYFIDKQNDHWLATQDGLFIRHASGEPVTHYNLSDYAERKFITTHVHRIYQDSGMNIWILTREEGVFMKKAGEKRFHQFLYSEADRNSLGSNETYDIYEDSSGRIWISTNGGGLNLYSRGSFLRIKHSPNDGNSLLNNNIRTIFEDQQGNLWIVSFQAGINLFINHPQLFRYYSIYPDQLSDYQSSTVCSMHLYGDNKIWIGTDGGGLKLLDRKTNTFKTFLPDAGTPGSFPDKVVMTILHDRNNIYWFGTYQGGLVRYNEEKHNFTSYQNNPADQFSIRSNFVTSLLEDSRGNLWIGTNGGGLNLFDRNTGQFRAYLNNPSDSNSLIDNFINYLIEDYRGNIWVATFWGLCRFDPVSFRFTNYLSNQSRSTSLSQNSVFCLLEDSRHRIWAGTRNGLDLFVEETGKFLYFTEKNGLAGNIIYSILEDESGMLWVSTNNGLSKFDPESLTSVNFSEADGLQGNEFVRNSSFKSESGELFFGGINGFNSFFPEKVKPREYIPPLVVTGFRIFDEEVPIGRFSDGRIILKKSITLTSELELEYSDKIFSFHLAAIDYITPENIVYAYKMEGFDENWNYTDAKYPIITYTNLSPGDYTLLIKAANKNIIDTISEGRSLKIHINPPFWKTWWAYLIYLLLILLMAYLIWQLSLQRIRERDMIRLEILKREKAEELHQAKLRFFTNISHEFRTPLTLIIGPLEQLLGKTKETILFRRQLDIMLKNARRMLRLINQLLDFRKFEGEKMSLKAEYTDIISFINDITHSFEEYASEKQINFRFMHPEDKFDMWFDPDKLDKILFNLLSNAFKFTPEKGVITLTMETGIKPLEPEPAIDEYVKISISDTGKGISEKELPRLFERFHQADSNPSFYQGSGLGLSLTKNFIEIHGGKIEVDSSPAGTTFHVYLPTGDKHLSQEQKIITESPGVNKYIHLIPESYTPSEPKKQDNDTEVLHSKPTILLVEDNIDLKVYLTEEACIYYNFYSASDGNEGYELAVEILPDLIISDVMMPQMDGYEFCRKIKRNIITSHIPVILLTAKTSLENEITGYESGADAYIPKPFKIDQLFATANAIIENRMRLREKFNAGRVLSNLPIKNTADDKFLQKVTDSVNKNISEVEFGVLELSKELGISRVHLHRKLKAIANLSPNEFIKNIRLQKASELLLKQEFTVSEVCYKVGFNSPAYFSSCFKAYYRMSPTDFLEKNIMP
jgi:signal transduction histidine kinase/ligand-binding sensor domain-containing protein/DNA-binding response OmpR family regulator